MSTVLSKWMTIFLALTIMFTPLFVYLDSLHRSVVDTVMQQGLKEASIKGHFTPEILADMRATLVNDYNFEDTTIEIYAQEALTQRGDYIWVEIVVPRGPIFILNLFNQGPDTISRQGKIMSEYIN